MAGPEFTFASLVRDKFLLETADGRCACCGRTARLQENCCQAKVRRKAEILLTAQRLLAPPGPFVVTPG